MDQQMYDVICRVFALLDKEEPTKREIEHARAMIETLVLLYGVPEGQDKASWWTQFKK